jgi:hypothetical protein
MAICFGFYKTNGYGFHSTSDVKLQRHNERVTCSGLQSPYILSKAEDLTPVDVNLIYIVAFYKRWSMKILPSISWVMRKNRGHRITLPHSFYTLKIMPNAAINNNSNISTLHKFLDPLTLQQWQSFHVQGLQPEKPFHLTVGYFATIFFAILEANHCRNLEPGPQDVADLVRGTITLWQASSTSSSQILVITKIPIVFVRPLDPSMSIVQVVGVLCHARGVPSLAGVNKGLAVGWQTHSWLTPTYGRPDRCMHGPCTMHHAMPCQSRKPPPTPSTTSTWRCRQFNV